MCPCPCVIVNVSFLDDLDESARPPRGLLDGPNYHLPTVVTSVFDVRIGSIKILLLVYDKRAKIEIIQSSESLGVAD